MFSLSFPFWAQGKLPHYLRLLWLLPLLNSSVTLGCRSMFIHCFRSLCQLWELLQDKELVSCSSCPPPLTLLSGAISQNPPGLLLPWAFILAVSSVSTSSPPSPRQLVVPLLITFSYFTSQWGFPWPGYLQLISHPLVLVPPFLQHFFLWHRSPSDMLCIILLHYLSPYTSM